MNRVQRLQQLAEAGMKLVEAERQRRADLAANQARLQAEQQADLERRRRERRQREVEAIAARLMADHGRLPFQAAIRRCGCWKGDRELIGILRGLWIQRTAERIAGAP